jgi:drug/metabolite transporter (DMT)-like permease
MATSVRIRTMRSTSFVSKSSRADVRTGLAFGGVILLGGGNAVAVRIATAELAPLWTAALRFGIAAVILLLVTAVARLELPRRRALIGSVLYGAVGFAGAFGCIHWALVQVPPASAQLVLALVPLLTLLLASTQGLERLRGASIAGALVGLGGVAVIVGAGLGAGSAWPLIVVGLGAVCMAQSSVIAKQFPAANPIATNAVAMASGAALLLAASALTGERQALPDDARTVAAIAYVALAGTLIVFSLFRYVLARWSASASSSVMLLMPLVTMAVSSLLAVEGISWSFVVGSALVLGGVALGTLRPRTGATRGPAPVGCAALPGCA